MALITFNLEFPFLLSLAKSRAPKNGQKCSLYYPYFCGAFNGAHGTLSREYDDYHDYNKKPKETEFTVFVHTKTGCKEDSRTRLAPVAGHDGSPYKGTFGTLYVADLLVTQNFSIHSPEVARSQGLQAQSSPNGTTAYNTFSFLFTKGLYKGSTLEFQGISKPTGKFELDVVSGTKYFRGVSGYAVAEVVLRKGSYSVTKVCINVKHYYPQKSYYDGATEGSQA